MLYCIHMEKKRQKEEKQKQRHEHTPGDSANAESVIFNSEPLQTSGTTKTRRNYVGKTISKDEKTFMKKGYEDIK